MSNKDEWGNIELPGLSDEKLFETNWNRKRTREQVEKLKKAQVKAGVKTPKNILLGIWNDPETWGPNRYTTAAKTLAKKFGVDEKRAMYIIRGSDSVDIDQTEHKKRLDQWYNEYGNSYTIITPGIDRLKEYDDCPMGNMKYNYSFCYQVYLNQWDNNTIRQKTVEWGFETESSSQTAYIHRYTLVKKIQPFLDLTSETHTFTHWTEAADFIFERTGFKVKSQGDLWMWCNGNPVRWQKPLSGWSFKFNKKIAYNNPIAIK